MTFNQGIPLVMTHAWRNFNDIRLVEVMTRFLDAGAKHILCTDISRDGALTGPNINLYQQVLSQFPEYRIQASGGVNDLDDILHLKNLNLAGVIIGRALYEKKFDLSEALSC